MWHVCLLYMYHQCHLLYVLQGGRFHCKKMRSQLICNDIYYTIKKNLLQTSSQDLVDVDPRKFHQNDVSLSFDEFYVNNLGLMDYFSAALLASFSTKLCRYFSSSSSQTRKYFEAFERSVRRKFFQRHVYSLQYFIMENQQHNKVVVFDIFLQ